MSETRSVMADDEPESPVSTPPDYGRSFADVYDSWYADVSDVDATVRRVAELCAGTERRVLELGVGSGRLALPLVDAGLVVTGIDLSDSMLDLLAAKDAAGSVAVVHGDMAVADTLVDPPFDVVLVAFNTFFNLASEDQQRRCLEGVARLLSPTGCLLVEAFVPTDPPDAVERDLSATRVELDRLVLAATEHDPTAQTITGQHVDITEAGVRLRPWRIRYATPVQIDAMATRAGLALAERHAGWEGEPLTGSTLTHVSRYVRMGEA
jgi:SAM-dependent methyltransferase